MRNSLLITVLGLFFASTASAEVTIDLVSEPGDYIGQGQTYFYDDTNADIQFSRNYDNGITVRINNLPGQPSNWWTMNIAAPGDAEIQPGLYDGATRFPFQGPTDPGLSFTGNGRGCNTSSGSFHVADVAYDEAGEVTALSVEFEQYCGNSTSALRGMIVFNSVPPVPPVGATAIGMSLTRIVCKNRTTGQKIVINSPSGAFIDCREAGLEVQQGDNVQVVLRGNADE